MAEPATVPQALILLTRLVIDLTEVVEALRQQAFSPVPLVDPRATRLKVEEVYTNLHLLVKTLPEDRP